MGENLVYFKSETLLIEEVVTYHQRLFDEWLESQPVIYSQVLETGNNSWSQKEWPRYDTHKARLVCIEEIK